MTDSDWWEELYEGLERAHTQESVFERTCVAALSLGFPLCCYGMRPAPPWNEQSITILETYPSGWMAHYRAAGFMRVDPTAAARSSATLVWSDKLFARSGRLWPDANDFGLRVGLGQPCWSVDGVYGLLSVARDAETLTELHLRHLRPRLRWLAESVHERMVSLLATTCSEATVPTLSLRERQVLTWTAEGKTSWEVGRILKISENTVNFHVKKIVAKLGAQNKSHAAAKAAALGLLRPEIIAS